MAAAAAALVMPALEATALSRRFERLLALKLLAPSVVVERRSGEEEMVCVVPRPVCHSDAAFVALAAAAEAAAAASIASASTSAIPPSSSASASAAGCGCCGGGGGGGGGGSVAVEGAPAAAAPTSSPPSTTSSPPPPPSTDLPGSSECGWGDGEGDGGGGGGVSSARPPLPNRLIAIGGPLDGGNRQVSKGTGCGI